MSSGLSDLPELLEEIDQSAIQIEIEDYLRRFGITLQSVYIKKMLLTAGISSSFATMNDDQREILHMLLEDKWQDLSEESQAARLKTTALLQQAGLTWEHKHIIEWVKRQQQPFTKLSVESLNELSQKLEALLAKRK